MARPEGFEPPTNGFGSRYSIQLSYGRVLMGFPGAGRKPIRIAKARDRHYSARRFAALRNDESVSSDPAGERARAAGLLCPASPKSLRQHADLRSAACVSPPRW